jgi:hypothetical protein
MRVFPDRQKGFAAFTRRFASFDADCRHGGDRLPPVVFIDPRFGHDFGAELTASDDLAPANLVDGQQLVAEVYRSLAALPAAERDRTLLVVTYDEHGGFYDHVPPPPAIGSDPVESADFATYGVRVPAFVCSAYAPAGASTDVLLDHASVHATIHRRFLPGAPFLSRRAEVANTLGAVLTRDQPRTAFPTEDLPGRLAIGHQARVEERQERREDRREDRQARQDERHERGEDRREERQARQDERQERRDDRREDRQGRQDERQEARQDRREDRQGRQDERREDRQERREERWEERAPTADDEDGGFRAWIAGLRADERDG